MKAVIKSKEDLGAFLRTLRLQSGLSQQTFARDVLGQTQQVWDRWENAAYAPPFELLLSVVDTLGFELVLRPKEESGRAAEEIQRLRYSS